jgi:hypothetical protein
LRKDRLAVAATNDPTPTKSVILCVEKTALARKPAALSDPTTAATCFKFCATVYGTVTAMNGIVVRGRTERSGKKPPPRAREFCGISD